MKKLELTIIQRIIAVFIYTTIFLFFCYGFNDWDLDFLSDSTNKFNLLFVSGALLLIFGSYLTETYFTKPVDIITNSTAVILVLLSIENSEDFIAYNILMLFALLFLILSITTIFIHKLFPKFEKYQYILYEIVTKIGQSKVSFSAVYLATLFSYFRDKEIEFLLLFTFWVILITQFFIEGAIKWVFDKYKILKQDDEVLGEAIGCENPFLYKVEVDFLKHKIKDIKRGKLVYLSLEKGIGAVGIIINEKQLLNKKWITIYLLEEKNRPLKMNLKTKTFISSTNTVFSKDNAVYSFDINTIEEKEKIEKNYFYKNRDNFIGYITDGSDINKIRFYSLIDSTNEKYQSVREGAVIKTKIHDQETLFQIIDGKTNKELLEKHDVYGYLIGVAQKLGKYVYEDVEKEDEDGNKIIIKEGVLETVEWLPNIYSPVFFDEMNSEIKSSLSIGKLPTTELEIVIKEPNSLITHNTAILGILGIGKSCLTFELIQKVISDTNVKIICIDITGEYSNSEKGLSLYIDNDMIDIGIDDINTELSEKTDWSVKDSKNDGGNVKVLKDALIEKIKLFTQNDSKRVKIINPEEIQAIQQSENAKNREKNGTWEMYAPFDELTVAETARIISESALEVAKSTGMQEEAKILLVFEEAHSLIPEWNSTANEGDKSASNGTAKVILQGRKYGLGSFVVTQRTANISKSILNQCNTIFALRIFDDTGKQFLENYIGSDYSNTLPTLEERHAIVVGKALKLKQPVIIELNKQKDVIL